MRNIMVGIGIAVALMLVPVANAEFVAHRTYEFGPIGDNYVIECIPAIEPDEELLGDVNPNEDCDPTGTMQDGSIDGGGAFFDISITQEFSTAQASVVDDLFGSGTVGFWLCSKLVAGEGGGWCDDDGEILAQACGDTQPVDLPTAEYEGLVVFLNGFIFQALDCDSTQAPSSTTGGVLDPAGGIYVTLA